MAQQSSQEQTSGTSGTPSHGGVGNSLINQTPAETYKDLLTVSAPNRNQGLEPTAKQVFDGEGVGSPLFLGTDSLDIVGTTSITGNVGITGTTTMTGNAEVTGALTVGNLVAPIMNGSTTITGDLTVTGSIINDNIGGDGIFDTPVVATSFALQNATTGQQTNAFSLASDGTVQVTANLVTKGAMTFMGAGGEEVRVDAASGGVTKGDGTKGKVMMKDTEVALNKGDKELFVAKEDGTTRMQSVDTLPANPNAGDMVNRNGEILIATGDETR